MADPGQPLPFEGLTPLQREHLRQERDVDIQECHTTALISDVSGSWVIKKSDLFQ